MDELPTTDERALRLLIVRLGDALNAAGQPVHIVQQRLSKVARAYGCHVVRISVFPTYLMVAMGRGEPATLELTAVAATPRLDQIAEVERLLALAERAAIPVEVALEQLDALSAVDAGFGIWRSVVGYATFTVGLCLILHPAAREVPVAAFLGALVGLLRTAARGKPDLHVLLPFVTAFTVALVAGISIRAGLTDLALRALAASLVVFLPGVAMTTGVLELAASQAVSGSSRLVSGVMHLALLAFGIIAGIQAAGVAPSRVLSESGGRLGAWAPWLGVLVFAVGAVVSNAAPRRCLPTLLLVLYATWAGQLLGNVVIGPYVSAFMGALVMTVTAAWVSRLPHALPPYASFMPGFWLLVPGALGLMGLTQLAGDLRTAGTQQLIATVVSMYGVAVGVLTGTMVLSGSAATGRYLSGRRTGAPAPR